MIEKPKLSFSHNWNNKLECDIYTTFRGFKEDRYQYRVSNTGKIHDVFLKRKHYHQATLRYVTHFEQLAQVDVTLLRLDTGLVEFRDIVELFRRFGIEPEDPVMMLVMIK